MPSSRPSANVIAAPGDTPMTQTLITKKRRGGRLPEYVPRQADGKPISAREMQVLDLTAQGMGSKEVACRLSISARTVRTHISNILRKVGALNAAHAVYLVYRCQHGDQK